MGKLTKAQIVQCLLDNKHITAEEAVVLLSATELQIEKKISFPSYENPWTYATLFNNMGMFPTSSIINKDKSNKNQSK